MLRKDNRNLIYDFFKVTNAWGGNFLGFKKIEKNQGKIKGPKEVEVVVVAGNIKYSIFGSLKRVKMDTPPTHLTLTLPPPNQNLPMDTTPTHLTLTLTPAPT